MRPGLETGLVFGYKDDGSRSVDRDQGWRVDVEML